MPVCRNRLILVQAHNIYIGLTILEVILYKCVYIVNTVDSLT